MKFINNKKIEQFNLKNNMNNFYIVIDFDKTITSAESSDSWDASANRKILGDSIANEMEELYKKYAPIELDYTLEFDTKKIHMVEWYSKCMNLYFKYNLTKEKLINSIENSNLIFRDGVKEFLLKMHESNVPIIILSAGIGNVIEHFLKVNKCLFDNVNIISNFIQFDNNGKMLKYNNKNMIHSLNKTMNGHIDEQQIKALNNKKYKLLFGDLIEDKNMINKEQWKDTIAVAFLNSKTDVNQKIYNQSFDIVLTQKEATFNCVNELIFS